MGKLFICAFVILVLSACNRSHLVGDTFITFYYKQTWCADPWPYGVNDSATRGNVMHYLDSLNLGGPEFNVWILQDDVAQACQACTCKSGKTIYAQVLFSGNAVIDKYNSLGFIKKN